jgi:hypothetical protein
MRHVHEGHRGGEVAPGSANDELRVGPAPGRAHDARCIGPDFGGHDPVELE